MRKKPRSFALHTLPLYVFAHFSHHLLTALPGPLLVFIRPDFGLSYSQSALVTSAFAMSYGLGQLPAGWLADHMGRKILLAIGILGVALAGLLVGLSQTYLMLLIMLVIMGLAGGGYHPSSTPMISASVEPKKLGRALGIHTIGGSAAYFVAPIVAAAIAAKWGWHMAFIALSVPTAVFGLFFFWMLRRQKAGNAAARSSHAGGPEDDFVPPPSARRRLIAFLFLTVVAGGIAGGIGPFLPLYFTDHLGLTKEYAASVTAITNSAGLWAGVLGGYLSDRLGKSPIIIISFLLGGVFIFLYGTLSWGLGYEALLLFMGINSYIRMPVSESFIMGLTAPRHRSTIYGIYYSSTQQSASLFALLMGYLIDKYGFKFCFNLTSVVVGLMTVIAAFFLWKTRD